MSRLFTFLFLTSMGFACAHAPKASYSHQGPPIAVELIVVGNVGFHLADAKAWHKYEKINDILEIMDSKPGLDTMAPWEFDVVGHINSPAELFTKSNLAPVAKRMGIEPDKILVLNARIMEQSQNQVTRATRMAQVAEAKSYSAAIQIELEVLYPAKDKVLATTSIKQAEDRFIDVPDYDQRPAVTQLVRKTVRQLIDELIHERMILPSAGRQIAQSKLQVQNNPKPVLAYTHQGSSLSSTLNKMDALSREALLYTRYRYFAPRMTLREFKRWNSAPPGVTVVKDPIRKLIGKHLVCANGQVIQYVFQWHRLRCWHALYSVTIVENQQRFLIQLSDGKRVEASEKCRYQ